MRRYIFYLAVGLITFIISVIACVSYALLKVNKTESESFEKMKQAQTLKDYTEDKKTKQPEFVEIKLKDLPCENETLRLVWNNLTDETASINIDRAERFKNCSDILEVWEDDKPIDLNNDGHQEIIVRGIENPYSRCGNNCYTYWIFQKTAEKKYRKLFEAEGYLPVIRKKQTQEYKDIMFEFYGSYATFLIGNYKFNGTKYVLKNCWSETKLYKNKDGEIVEGKKYRIENYDCNETWLSK
jgi:hypothetical protein